jgi:hypothetical protein
MDETSSRQERIAGEWIEALHTSLTGFGSLVVEDRVVAAWSDPSVLEGYSVGGIAGHVLGLMQRLHQVLVDDEPTDLEPIRYQDWYGAGPGEWGQGSKLGHLLVRLGESAAEDGPHAVAARLASTTDALSAALNERRRDRLFPLASVPGSAVRLDDFLRTRFVEIIVHADDIAVSAGVPTPAFPRVAWQLAFSVLADAAAERDNRLGLMRTLTRPDRSPGQPRPLV